MFLVTVPLPFAVDADFNCQYTACLINFLRIYSRGAACINTDKILGCLSTRRYPPHHSHIDPTKTRTFHVHSHIITGPPKCPIECKFGQCASGPIFITLECVSGLVFTTQECANASLVNVRVVWL